MSRRVLAAGLAVVLIAVVTAGFIPWRVTGWVQRWLDARPRPLGFSVDQARWVPWKHLELNDVRVQAPGGGKLHLARAEVYLRLKDLVRGKVSTEWILGEIRMDPGSWKIRPMLAAEMLSAMPVATQGSVRLNGSSQRMELERLWLTGPVLQLQGAASFPSQEEMHLHLQGALSRSILVAMQVLSPRDVAEPWQPFRLQLDGPTRSPRIQFEMERKP